MEVKITRPPSGKIVGTNEASVPAAPVRPSARLTSVVVRRQSRTNTSGTAPACRTSAAQSSTSTSLKLVAVEANATYRPSAEIDGPVESASAPAPVAESAPADQCRCACLQIPDEHVGDGVVVLGAEVVGLGDERDEPAVGRDDGLGALAVRRGTGRPARPADQRRVVRRRVRRRGQADGGRQGDRQAADAVPRSPAGPSRVHGSDLRVTRPSPQRCAAAVLTAVFTEGALYGGWSVRSSADCSGIAACSATASSSQPENRHCRLPLVIRPLIGWVRVSMSRVSRSVS